jgi:hypothetical protein
MNPLFARLKIWLSQGSAGSIPVRGTLLDFTRSSSILLDWDKKGTKFTLYRVDFFVFIIESFWLY